MAWPKRPWPECPRPKRSWPERPRPKHPWPERPRSKRLWLKHPSTILHKAMYIYPVYVCVSHILVLYISVFLHYETVPSCLLKLKGVL